MACIQSYLLKITQLLGSMWVCQQQLVGELAVCFHLVAPVRGQAHNCGREGLGLSHWVHRTCQ